jgi:hypothetical protein
MAISPEQAKQGWPPEISAEEKRRVGEIERQLDERIAKIFKENPTSSNAGFAIDNVPMGSLTPEMQAYLAYRYKSQGWREVVVHEHENNYSIQLFQ